MEIYKSTEEVFEATKSAIDKGKLSKDLRAYLDLFRSDELSTGDDIGSLNYKTQYNKLVQLMRAKYINGQGLHQTISKLEGDFPQFFELLLVMHFLAKEKEIILTNNIGYGRYEIATGIYSSRKFPHAEYVIVGKELKDKIVDVTELEQTNVDNARVLMDGRIVCIVVTGDNTYQVARLDEGGTEYLFMQYLLKPENRNIEINIDEIRRIKGLAATEKLTELARYSGFTKPYKKAFFPVSKKERIRFSPIASLDTDQIAAIKVRHNNIVSKS